MSSGFSIDVLLIAGRAAFLVFSFVLAAVLFVRFRRDGERHHAELKQQLAQTLDRLTVLETRLAENHAVLAALNDHVASLQSSATAPTHSRSYELAIRLARGGADREQLMASCGLTRQEAELVLCLHAPGAKRATARSASVQ